MSGAFHSRRLERLPVYAVAALAQRKRELMDRGVDVIDLGAGDADLAPPGVAVEALCKAAAEPAMSRYAFQAGLQDYRTAIARYMDRRFGVTVDPSSEVLPLLGSKEGLAHLPFAVADPGDICIVPEPGYPAYVGGSIFAGAEVYTCPLRRDNGFLVELVELPEDVLRRARIVYLNYPNNPTGATAPPDYVERTIGLCRKHNILIAWDNPYVELTYDGYRAPSILEFEGARDIALEFHSFSKSFGMTGWRLGWVTGNPDAIQALSKVKTYVDTGAFLALQRAGAQLLDRAEEAVKPVVASFRERRDVLVSALQEVGWACDAPRGAMYLWLRLPAGIKSADFAQNALEQDGIATLAGSAFGEAGEGFVRLSFIVEPDRLREAAARLGRALERSRAGLSST